MDEQLQIDLPEFKELARLTREANELIKTNEESETIKNLEAEINELSS